MATAGAIATEGSDADHDMLEALREAERIGLFGFQRGVGSSSAQLGFPA